MDPTLNPTSSRSAELLARARRVVPNGVFGHRRAFAFAAGVARAIPEDYPHFVAGANGCRFTDVDGSTYIDYLCGYGPMIVGYDNERVEAAAAAERGKALCYNFPTDAYVALAERLVATVRGADWAAFALNGSDALTMALVVARAATGRSAVVIAEGAFHGNLTWASAGPGWDPADRCRTRTVRWGDADELGRTLEEESVAAVVLCPYEQLVGADNRLPPADYWPAVRRHCNAAAAVLVVDDVRSGFRLDAGGSCAWFGIEPDLVCLSKAMANGYPAAALVGRDALRDAAESVFVSGTFWGYPPALAAALETLAILGDPGFDACAHMAEMGRRLTSGLGALAADLGVPLVTSGPEAMPLVRFVGDDDFTLACRFAASLAAHGTFVHPTHNWFLSLAHGPDDVDTTLEHAAAALPAALAGP